MKLSERMLEYRARNNLSTKAAAEKAGISDQTWRYVEKELQSVTAVTKTKIELLVGKEEE